MDESKKDCLEKLNVESKRVTRKKSSEKSQGEYLKHQKNRVSNPGIICKGMLEKLLKGFLGVRITSWRSPQ